MNTHQLFACKFRYSHLHEHARNSTITLGNKLLLSVGVPVRHFITTSTEHSGDSRYSPPRSNQLRVTMAVQLIEDTDNRNWPQAAKLPRPPQSSINYAIFALVRVIYGIPYNLSPNSVHLYPRGPGNKLSATCRYGSDMVQVKCLNNSFVLKCPTPLK